MREALMPVQLRDVSVDKDVSSLPIYLCFSFFFFVYLLFMFYPGSHTLHTHTHALVFTHTLLLVPTLFLS